MTFSRRHIENAGSVLIAAAVFAVTALSLNLAPFRYFENRIHDTYFQLRASLFPEKRSRSVVIVGIEKKTLSAHPEPVIFWDSEFTAAVQGISRGGAASIGFDILHLSTVESRRYNFGRMKLGGVLMSDPAVVLPYAIDNGDLSIPLFLSREYRETFGIDGEINAEMKLKLLRIAERSRGISFGYANLSDDSDGIVRSLILYEPGTKPGPESFALKIYMKYASAAGWKIERRGGEIAVNGKPVPGRIIINYRGAPGTIPMIPMNDVIQNSRNEEYLNKNFSGKAVILGSYDPALGDVHSTPFISSAYGTTRGMYGAEIVANSVDTLIEGRMINEIPYALRLLLILILAAAGTILSRRKTTEGLILFGAAGLIFTAVSFLTFAWGGHLTGMLPLASLLLSFFAGYIYTRYLVGRERHHLQSVLGSYLDPRVVEKVVNERGMEILRGERREITVMFADIRNFTTLSEKKEKPEDVVDILNIYLPVMSSIIRKHEGCVDKFIGDGIMAFWNAPNDVADHAEKAVLCAIEMQSAMKEINAEASLRGLTDGELAIGIGIHTGNAVVGNVGSSIKHDYTAIGDTVNSASRLEGKTKDLGHTVLISGPTKAMLNDGRIRTITAGSVEVKGKSEKIAVYGVETE